MKASRVSSRHVRGLLSGPAAIRCSAPVLRQQHLQGIAACTISTTAIRDADPKTPPPQPQPVSQERSTADSVGLDPDVSVSQTRDAPRVERYQQPLRPPTSRKPPLDRIDLSSIEGINRAPSYRPPPRYSDPETAEAKLKAMFEAAEKRTPQPPSQRPDRLDGPFTSLDAYAKPRSTFTGTTQELRDILDSIPAAPATQSSTGATPFSLYNPESKQPLRLRPTLGRFVNVNNDIGMDLTKAFRVMESKCALNKVRVDERDQRYHVRRGQKRKQEKSQNWRRLFKAGFVHEIGRVRRMMKQGW